MCVERGSLWCDVLNAKYGMYDKDWSVLRYGLGSIGEGIFGGVVGRKVSGLRKM